MCSATAVAHLQAQRCDLPARGRLDSDVHPRRCPVKMCSSVVTACSGEAQGPGLPRASRSAQPRPERRGTRARTTSTSPIPPRHAIPVAAGSRRTPSPVMMSRLPTRTRTAPHRRVEPLMLLGGWSVLPAPSGAAVPELHTVPVVAEVPRPPAELGAARPLVVLPAPAGPDVPEGPLVSLPALAAPVVSAAPTGRGGPVGWSSPAAPVGSVALAVLPVVGGSGATGEVSAEVEEPLPVLSSLSSCMCSCPDVCLCVYACGA